MRNAKDNKPVSNFYFFYTVHGKNKKMKKHGDIPI